MIQTTKSRNVASFCDKIVKGFDEIIIRFDKIVKGFGKIIIRFDKIVKAYDDFIRKSVNVASFSEEITGKIIKILRNAGQSLASIPGA